jgi:hypothetical protein
MKNLHGPSLDPWPISLNHKALTVGDRMKTVHGVQNDKKFFLIPLKVPMMGTICPCTKNISLVSFHCCCSYSSS